MTTSPDPATVLPSLALLSHRVRVLPMDAASLVKMPEQTILLLDGRDDLANAKTLCRMIHASGLTMPILLILTEGGFTVVNAEWGVSDVIVASAPPPRWRAACALFRSAATPILWPQMARRSRPTRRRTA